MEMNLENIGEIASNVINKAHKLNLKSATVIAITGELGSGKTTLTQEIARQLSIKENVISPTFVIMKRYKAIDEIFKQLIHIDAYRLKESSELMKLGFQDLLADSGNLIIIEWPEQVPDCIPGNAIRIELSHDKEDTRMIKFQG